MEFARFTLSALTWSDMHQHWESCLFPRFWAECNLRHFYRGNGRWMNLERSLNLESTPLIIIDSEGSGASTSQIAAIKSLCESSDELFASVKREFFPCLAQWRDEQRSVLNQEEMILFDGEIASRNILNEASFSECLEICDIGVSEEIAENEAFIQLSVDSTWYPNAELSLICHRGKLIHYGQTGSFEDGSLSQFLK